jgi:hypothetical protein
VTTNHDLGAATTANPKAAFPLQRPQPAASAGARSLPDAVSERFAVAFGLR